MIFDSLTPDQIIELQHYTSPVDPFGPTNASDVQNSSVRSILFNEHNALCKAFRRDPKIIVGRRGSGKTSIITNPNLAAKDDLIVAIDPAEAIRIVRDSFVIGGENAPFVEDVARYWAVLLNTLLMAKIANSAKDCPLILSYLSTCQIPNNANLSSIVNAIKKTAETQTAGVTTFIAHAVVNFMQIGITTYEKALSDLDRFLKERGKTAVIVMDSLEDYSLDLNGTAPTIAGLLKCVGEYQGERRKIRLCIPGEYYFAIRECSNNPLKDLTKNLLLQWLPREINSVLAWRHLLFLRLYDRDKYELLKRIDFASRDDCLRILNNIIPKTLINGLGIEENCLVYVFRHTQLLPRQVIFILNKIFSMSDDAWHTRGFQEAADIVDGVSSVERLLCDEIFSGYKHKFPDAPAYCEKAIPELPRTFQDSQLRDVYRKFARAARTKHGYLEYDEFKAMLIEIGAIGRVGGKTHVYAEGEFEFARTGKLSVSVDDVLCLHPMFSGAFSSPHNARKGLLVYAQKEWHEQDRGRHLTLEGNN